MAIPLWFPREIKLRTLISLSIFLVLFPAGLGAQTASPAGDVPVPGLGLVNGGQPLAKEGVVSALNLPLDMKWAGLAPTANPWPEFANLGAVSATSEKSRDSAFIKAAPQMEKRKDTTRDRVAIILLSLAVHAAVTWDAQSTNHFFSHCPAGYKPTEVDPLMRPFAGKASMYPMANLLFAAPFDLLLYRTRHSRKLTRVLTYAAASTWVGVEMQQSIVNIRHEHISRGK